MRIPKRSYSTHTQPHSCAHIQFACFCISAAYVSPYKTACHSAYNHITDFDAGVDGLNRILQKAPGKSVLPILSANLVDPSVLDRVQPWVIKEYQVQQPHHSSGSQSGASSEAARARVLRVGIFGLLGVDAAFASRANRAKEATFVGYNDDTDERMFASFYTRASEVVARLRGAEACDLVVCLLHGGTDGDAFAEDVSLARAVPGLDAIVSGHTHGTYYTRVDRPESEVPSTHMWQCGSEGAKLGVVDFDFTPSRGLVRTARATAKGSHSHCTVIDEKSSSRDAGMVQQTDAWRVEAGALLGLDLSSLAYNGTPSGLLSGNMTEREVSSAVTRAVLSQINQDLKQGSFEAQPTDNAEPAGPAPAPAPGLPPQSVSPLLGNGRGLGGAALQLSAYISCVACVRSEVHVVDGRVPLLVSDVLRMDYITGSRPVSLFYIHKSDFLAACDLVDLLFRFVSPLFGITVSPNVIYSVGWGIPFLNRIKRFSISGVDYNDLPDRLLIGTNGYVQWQWQWQWQWQCCMPIYSGVHSGTMVALKMAQGSHMNRLRAHTHHPPLASVWLQHVICDCYEWRWNRYIAPFFWRSAELSHGAMASLPLDRDGKRIPQERLADTYATGLPVEFELLLRFLSRQSDA